MEKSKNLETFLGLVSDEKSDLLEKLQWRADNHAWLDRSAKIAIRILSKLRENRANAKYPSSQKELAELMQVTPQQVNKILKGNENLTLETISNIEKCVGLTLVEVTQNSVISPYILPKSPNIVPENYMIRENEAQLEEA